MHGGGWVLLRSLLVPLVIIAVVMTFSAWAMAALVAWYPPVPGSELPSFPRALPYALAWSTVLLLLLWTRSFVKRKEAGN